jgi:uncharacterized membrane protein YsdA (DUF1294 family)
MAMLIKIASAYLIAINIASFILMGIDKRKAKKKLWRVPEKTLFLTVIVGGAMGGVAGMYVFKHKTKYWYFKYGYPIILIMQVLVLIFIDRYGF